MGIALSMLGWFLLITGGISTLLFPLMLVGKDEKHFPALYGILIRNVLVTVYIACTITNLNV